jgi:hypothetical protein
MIEFNPNSEIPVWIILFYIKRFILKFNIILVCCSLELDDFIKIFIKGLLEIIIKKLN